MMEKLMTVAIVGFGAIAVFDGLMTVGELVAFQMLAGRVSAPLVQLVALIHEYQEASLSVAMLGEVMNRPAEVNAARGLRTPIQGRIDFEGVSFQYPETTAPALTDISLSIPAGTFVGVVGRSGSGKSTFARLIQALYPLQAGIIRIDGHDLREIDLSHLRRHIGVVPQDAFLFRGSVRENIAITRPEATFEEVVVVAELAGAREFIEKLPKGFETLLEEGAVNLSGGQKQRLSIARALLRRPPILILDEATSALDPDSEAIVVGRLGQISRGRTTIVISHRLVTIRHADMILVLEGGRIVGCGRHEALLDPARPCTVYRHLWQQQTERMR
ncbi:MAG: peptidase domain-containing ABC transporter [Candidatus Competibacteraceae bacterium]|nr:peptidase domain-containing ABC transporter [Candidatus Competibacteraceae bacterium]